MIRNIYVSTNREEEKDKKFFTEFKKEYVNGFEDIDNLLFRKMSNSEVDLIIEKKSLPENISFVFEDLKKVEFYGRTYNIITFVVILYFSENDELFCEEKVSFILNSEVENNFLMGYAKGEEIVFCNYLNIYEDKYFSLSFSFEKNEELLKIIKDVEIRSITLEEEVDVISIFKTQNETIRTDKRDTDLSDDKLRKMMDL